LLRIPEGRGDARWLGAGRLTRVAPDGRKTKVSQYTGGPNGAAIESDGEVYICNNGGFNWQEVPKYGLRPTGQADNSPGDASSVSISPQGRAKHSTPNLMAFAWKGGANAERRLHGNDHHLAVNEVDDALDIAAPTKGGAYDSSVATFISAPDSRIFTQARRFRGKQRTARTRSQSA